MCTEAVFSFERTAQGSYLTSLPQSYPNVRLTMLSNSGARSSHSPHRSHRGARGGPQQTPRGGYRGLGGRGSPMPLSTRGLSPAPGIERAPRQVCDFYWSTGQCNRGFDCTFRHQVRANVLDGNLPQQQEGEVEFFSLEGLSFGNGTTRSVCLNMKPAEVHNHLKTFLEYNMSLESTLRAESFVRIFGSINKRNTYWVSASIRPSLCFPSLTDGCRTRTSLRFV